MGKIKDLIWPHHNETDVLEVSIIRGEDHNHLEMWDRSKRRVHLEATHLDDAIDQAILFLEGYKGGKNGDN
jgi:hypothetical protein